MATYLFLTLPAYGHVNPTLAIAQELVTRGQQVIYYLPEEFREAVEATGATFRSYQSQLMKHIARMSPLLGDESRLVLPQVLDRIRADAPDVIVHEPRVRLDENGRPDATGACDFPPCDVCHE